MCRRTEGTSKTDHVEQPTPVSDATQTWQEEREIFDINAQKIQLQRRRSDQERSVASGPWRGEERSTAAKRLSARPEGC